jgi:hypothetical protein
MILRPPDKWIHAVGAQLQQDYMIVHVDSLCEAFREIYYIFKSTLRLQNFKVKMMSIRVCRRKVYHTQVIITAGPCFKSTTTILSLQYKG